MKSRVKKSSQKKDDQHASGVTRKKIHTRQMIRGSGCSKSRLAKAAGAEVAVQPRNEKWHAAVAISAFSSQNAQNTSAPDLFLKLYNVENWHAAVARSTFASQNAKTLRG